MCRSDASHPGTHLVNMTGTHWPTMVGMDSVTLSLVQYRTAADRISGRSRFACQADYLVTHDQEHFLRNTMLGDLPCKAGSPGDCLTWLRQHWTEEVKAE